MHLFRHFVFERVWILNMLTNIYITVIINIGWKRYKFSKKKCNKETVICTGFCSHASFSSYENNIVETIFLPDALIIFAHFERINLILQANLTLKKYFNCNRYHLFRNLKNFICLHSKQDSVDPMRVQK